MASFDSTLIARLATGLYGTQIGSATMQEALNAVNGTAYGSVAALANALFTRDFGSASNATVASLIVRNVGITTAAEVAEATALVTSVLAGSSAAQKGATVLNLLNSFAGLTAPTYASAVAAFNTQIGLAVTYAQKPGSVDTPLNAPSTTSLNIESLTVAGVKSMHLTGNQDIRIDFTNKANQITGLDLNGDGVIKADGVENKITGKAADFAAVDAYSRNPWNHSDTANNFLGDIYYDGTGYQGDGKTTNGNIFLGGLGVDTALGGVGNDFLAGGGTAQGRTGVDTLSGGRNADFFFAELSLLTDTDGNHLSIDGGTTSDNVSAGTAQSVQDSDWLLLEASDDDEPVTIVLRDDSVLDPTFSAPFGLSDNTFYYEVTPNNVVPGGGPGTGNNTNPLPSVIDRTGYVITRAGVTIGTLRDIENLDASGNIYGFLNALSAVQLGGRGIDDRDVAGASNYGFGSSAQLRVIGSNVANIIIGGYDNDYLQGANGNDLIFGGNLKQLLETVTGGVTNPNLNLITNDGRDELYGGSGEDNLVFEADGGVVDGDNTGADGSGNGTLANATTGGVSDTLWLTKYSLGTTTLATLVPDLTLRFDLTSQFAQTEGSNPEGGAGYGGANAAGTADQTNYASATAPEFGKRVTVLNMDNVDATGLGAIDFFSAGSSTAANRPETAFTNHQNFDGYDGALNLRGTQGNNQFYSGQGNDVIEGRGNAVPQAGTTAVTQIDDLEGNNGQDDFYFAIDGDFVVGDPALGGTGLGGQGTGDGYDVIRRKIDANGDGWWDQNPASTNLQNPSNGGFIWGQDFGLNATSTSTSSVLTIDIQRTDAVVDATNLTANIQNVVQIVTGVKPVGATTFTPLILNTTGIQTSTTYTGLVSEINKAILASAFPKLVATLAADGHTITITDPDKGELADNLDNLTQTTATAEVTGAGVSVNQIANTTTKNKFVFAPPVVTTVPDRLIYKAYEDRSDNEGVDDDVIFGSTVSLGVDAYAQDLVVSFQKDATPAGSIGTGVTTFIAEDQNWRINFENLTTQDRVTIAVNGVTYQLQVGYQLDGTIVANEDTNSFPQPISTANLQAIQTNFLARFAGYINSFSDNDTAAGSVQATATATVLSFVQNTYNGEQTVYMRAPVVTVENLSGGQAPNNPGWSNPATGAGGTGIVNASQHEVQLYQFDGSNGLLNTDTVKFWGQEEVQRSILATTKTTGGAMNGVDSLIVDGEANTIKPKGDLAAKVGNAATQLIVPAQDDVLERLVTTNSALNVNFAVHGDDLLITGAGVDQIKGGTGDDRVIGSVGSPTAPAIAATTGGEILDGGKNYYAVKLLDETEARVYVLNRWEASSANIVSVLPELSGKVITSIASIGQTENGTAVFNAIAATGSLPAGTFSDTLQYQQEDFSATARFTITLDDFSVVGGVVQTQRDGAGLVSIDANGDGTFESFARFSNFENIRTVSGTGAANAATPGVSNSGGQGNDTLDVSALSTATGGISYDLTKNASAGNVNYSVDAHAQGVVAPTVPTAAQLTAGALRPQVLDFETNILKVDGVESVIGGTGDDLVTVDETEAAKNNSFSGGLGDDRIDYQNNWTAGVVSPAAEPVVTINVNTAADTDTVVMTGGRLGLVIATDTLSSVEFISLNGFTAAGQQERDVLNVANVSGATVDYNDLVQSTATGVVNSGTVRDAAGVIQVTVEDLFEVEQVVGSAGNDTVKLADADVMLQNSREDAANATPVADITFATFIDFDELSTATATLNKRIAFVNQTTAQIEDVRNNGEFSFDLAGGSDTVDYSMTADSISVVVELDPARPNQFVMVDSDGTRFADDNADGITDANDLIEAGDRIDVLTNVERIVAAQNESILDLSASNKGLEIKFAEPASADRVAATATADAFDITTVRISDLANATPLSRTYVEYRNVADAVAATVPRANALWSRIEGSDNAERVIMNSAHSLDLNTFNLRGGSNEVKYNELTKSITLVLSATPFSAAAPLTTGRVTGVVTFQDGTGAGVTGPLIAGSQSHTITSYTADNGIAAGSLRIAASQDAEDTLQFSGLDSKLFVLAETGTTDNQITVRLTTGSSTSSVVLTGFELVTDAAGDDVYDFGSFVNAVAGLNFIDNATGDHDTVKVGNDVVVTLGTATSISLASINGLAALAPAGFDFDVLDITKVTDTAITSVVGVATAGAGEGVGVGVAAANIGSTDEIVFGAINSVTSALLFDSVVLTDATVAQSGSTYVLNTTANSLVAGSRTVSLTNGANTLSFGGLVLEQPGAPTFLRPATSLSVTSAVTVTVVGAEAVSITGGTKDDSITGGAGGDTLRGGSGNDTLNGNFIPEAAEVHTYTISNPAGGAGETVTINGFTVTEGATIQGIIVANNDADAIGAAFVREWTANPASFTNGQATAPNNQIGSITYDALTNTLTFTFKASAGDVLDALLGAPAGTAAASVSAETVTVPYSARAESSDTYVFEATAALNGVDIINNFNATGLGTDDVINATAFLGAATNNGGLLAANITAGLDLSGAANYGIVYNKSSLAASDIAAAAAAGKVAVENNSKAVVLVTGDVDGNLDGTVNGYDVYYVEDTDTTAATSYTVTKVATINGNAELSAFALDGSTTFTGTAGADTLVGTDAAETFTPGEGTDSVTGGGGQDTINLTEVTPVADTVVFGSAFTAGNASADTITGFVFGAGADVYDVGFNVNNGTTLATSALALVVPAVVASNGAATANDVIFTFTGAGDVMAASTVANAVANAVTALTSGADFAAANMATGDSFVLMLNDGANTFLFHYVADATPATTTAADLELIGVFTGVQTGTLVVGDIG